MHGDRFDSIVRRIAESAARRENRRTVLRAVGAGGAALVCGSVSALAVPNTNGQYKRTRYQTTVDPLIEEIAFQLEYDQEKIFRFVADEIGYEPYAGVLRGPLGTLWGGAGNSADQAVLLKALLDASLIDSRFAIGMLPQAETDQLGASIAAAPKMPDRVSVYLEATTTSIAAEQATPVADAEAIQNVLSFRDELVTAARTAAEADVERFTTLLEQVGLLDQVVAGVIPEFERTQHVWLQVRSGTEVLDLDPSFAGEIGDVFAQMPQDTQGTFESLDDTFYHWIRTTVHADVRSGDGLAEQSLLDYEVRSSDMIGEDFTVIHIEPQALEGIGMAIGGALEGTVGYYPVIVLGQESFVADAMLTFGAGSGVFGDVFGDDEGTGPADGEAIAEYLIVTVRSPGQEPVSARHTIFDRSAGARLGDEIDFAAIQPIDIVRISEDEEGFLPVKQVLALAAVSSFVPEAFVNKPISEETTWSYLTGATHGLHTSRQVIGVGNQPFVDRPNISLIAYIPEAGDKENRAADVLLEANLMLQGFGSRDSDRTRNHIRAGVLAQRGEALALDPTFVDVLSEAGLAGVPARVSGLNAGVVFDAADTAGIEILVLQPGSSSEAIDDLENTARALLDSHLAAGRVVIIPESLVEIPTVGLTTAWWVYDPATGVFYDQLADGRSGAAILYGPFTEYMTKLWAFTKTVKGVFALAACLAAVARAASAILALDTSRAGSFSGLEGNVVGAVASCGAYGAGAL